MTSNFIHDINRNNKSTHSLAWENCVSVHEWKQTTQDCVFWDCFAHWQEHYWSLGARGQRLRIMCSVIRVSDLGNAILRLLSEPQLTHNRPWCLIKAGDVGRRISDFPCIFWCRISRALMIIIIIDDKS